MSEAIKLLDVCIGFTAVIYEVYLLYKNENQTGFQFILLGNILINTQNKE